MQRILCSFALCKCRIIAAVKDAMHHQSDMHCNRSETPSEVPRSKALPSAAFIPLYFFFCAVFAVWQRRRGLCAQNFAVKSNGTMKIIIKHLKQTFSVNLTLAAFVKIISERFVVPCAGTDKGSPEGGGVAEEGRPG